MYSTRVTVYARSTIKYLREQTFWNCCSLLAVPEVVCCSITSREFWQSYRKYRHTTAILSVCESFSASWWYNFVPGVLQTKVGAVFVGLKRSSVENNTAQCGLSTIEAVHTLFCVFAGDAVSSLLPWVLCLPVRIQPHGGVCMRSTGMLWRPRPKARNLESCWTLTSGKSSFLMAAVKQITLIFTE